MPEDCQLAHSILRSIGMLSCTLLTDLFELAALNMAPVAGPTECDIARALPLDVKSIDLLPPPYCDVKAAIRLAPSSLDASRSDSASSDRCVDEVEFAEDVVSLEAPLPRRTRLQLRRGGGALSTVRGRE